ncbi:MAG TPA: hypothetical protein DD490_33270, partial [Acidobacteria bacterium]|nr:hypothetical protein [Acidobacteriota bacterium]
RRLVGRLRGSQRHRFAAAGGPLQACLLRRPGQAQAHLRGSRGHGGEGREQGEGRLENHLALFLRLFRPPVKTRFALQSPAMPELPEVEVLRRSLEPHLVGDRIERVEVHNAALREPVDRATLVRHAAGREVEALRRRGKYLLINLSGGRTVVVHLGMSGRLTLVPAGTPPEPHEHVALHLRSGGRLRFRDPRRFGVVFSLPTAALAGDPHFSHLGAEPLEPGFDGAFLARAAAGRRGPVKPFLMDGTVVVGIGN